MLTVLKIILVLAMTVIFPVAAPSQEQKDPEPFSEGGGEISLFGTVQTVDSAAGRISVQTTQGDIKDFTLSDETLFAVNGKRTEHALVKEGDSVTVHYDASTMKVETLDVLPTAR